MQEPPTISQPAFSAPMGARAWVGGTPFMNPSAPFTEPPSANEGPQRHGTNTTANSQSSGGAGGVGGSQKVSYSSSSAASLATSTNSGTSSWVGRPAGASGQTPDRQRINAPPPPASVYAPPGHPEYQPSDECNPLLNPTNR